MEGNGEQQHLSRMERLRESQLIQNLGSISLTRALALSGLTGMLAALAFAVPAEGRESMIQATPKEIERPLSIPVY